MKKRDESSYLEEGGRKLLPKKHQKSPPFFLFQPQIEVKENEHDKFSQRKDKEKIKVRNIKDSFQSWSLSKTIKG